MLTEGWGHDLSSLYPQHLVIRKPHEQRNKVPSLKVIHGTEGGQGTKQMEWKVFSRPWLSRWTRQANPGKEVGEHSEKVVVSMGYRFLWGLKNRLDLSTGSLTIFVPRFFFWNVKAMEVDK